MTEHNDGFQWVDESPVDGTGFLRGLSASRRRFMRNAAVVGGGSLLLGGAGTGIAAADHQPPIYGLTLVPGGDGEGKYGDKSEKKGKDRDGDDSAESALALLEQEDGNALVPVDLDTGEIGTSDAVPIDGVDDLLVGLDYRPSDGMLYAIDVNGTLYTVDMPDDGDSVDAETVGSADYPGTDFEDGIGFDFNPVADAIRIVTTDGDSFVTSADDGSIVRQDPDTFYADDDENAGTAPQLSSAGYTNSVADPDSTELYDIDSNLDVLVEQTADPDVDNTSELVTVGDLGVDTAGANGFDISGTTGTAYALLPVDGQSQLYTIDLDMGTATLVDGDDEEEMMADEVDDIAILNFALTLEHLEAAYYNEFLDEYSEKEVERSEAARVFAPNGSRFSTYQKIQQVRDHEEAHVEALTQTIEDLGGEPVEPLDYEFPYESVEEFAALSATIEAVGVSAYAGAAPLISNPDLIPPALSIHSVEARHTSYFNVLNTTSPFPDAFDEPRTMEEVLEIASAFIVS